MTQTLNADELRSIDPSLTSLNLVGITNQNLMFEWRARSNLRIDPFRDISSPHIREEIPLQADIRTEVERLENLRREDSAVSRRKNSDGSTQEEPFERTGSAWKTSAQNKEGIDQKIQLW